MPTKMQRVQLYIDPKQYQWAKKTAAKRNQSISDLFRTTLQKEILDQPDEEKEENPLLQFAGIFDAKTVDEVQNFIDNNKHSKPIMDI
ncbi:MAG: hypothetical protein WCK98_02265 [bacterium]